MVYLLEPVPRRWMRTAGVLGDLLRKQIDGIALQPGDVPAEKKLEGRFELPDFGSAGDGFRFVSDRGRAALEELTPGCVAFFPISLKVPTRMRSAEAYFFFDVLPRAQLIDWDSSPTGPRLVRAADGRESRALGSMITDPSVKFKAERPETPPIWREADLDRPTVNFFVSKKHVFLRDETWEALNARFPGQLVARKFA
ncbi:imm11 family protein [Bradyrhizobium septentrionale]|uniref:DUF1629 domain-containing protein n=1 Tax=Bradyrhizobium septentrionale TaxID=1404411 RepID=A0A973W5A6_9BRAD|nr:DUF1629 domain-containing protein [Bradyrhizobium septentrionale]UGY16548.1 hypothetical protein HAP48_0003020 [Bradyrhizobium septentrionale]UGY25205.1 hypothetical protein HU675_0046380 [Bradyrhizobium septentrionale]